MVLFFISIHVFAKRGLGSFAENNVFRKQDKFAYKTEIWAVRANLLKSVQVCEVREMRLSFLFRKCLLNHSSKFNFKLFWEASCVYMSVVGTYW